MKKKDCFFTLRLFFILLCASALIIISSCTVDENVWFGNFKDEIKEDTTSNLIFLPSSSLVSGSTDTSSAYSIRQTIGSTLTGGQLMELYKSEDNKKQVEKSGWELDGWKIQDTTVNGVSAANRDTDFYNALVTDSSGSVQSMTVTTCDVEFVPVWKISDHTPYYVYHYFENIADTDFTMNPDYTQIFYGTTFTDVEVSCISVPGFTLSASDTATKSLTITEDGQASALFNYTRNLIQVIIDYNGDDAVTANFVNTKKYGSSLTGYITPVKTDYSLTGWQAVNSEGTSTVFSLPSTYPVLDTVYTAIWTRNMVSASGIAVSMPTYSNVDLGLTVGSLNTATKKFTASVRDTSYATYVWIFNGNVVQAGASSSAEIDYSTCSSGTYELLVTAVSADGTNRYTATSSVVINSGAL